MKDIKMEGVREYAEDMSVDLGIYKKRLVIKAYNEAGYNGTKVDLEDVIEWLRRNKPELLKANEEIVPIPDKPNPGMIDYQYKK